MWTMLFWKSAAERAIKTAAQSLVLLWAADSGFNVLDVDVRVAFGLSAGALVLSLLTSVASSAVGEKGTPSLTAESMPKYRLD